MSTSVTIKGFTVDEFRWGIGDLVKKLTVQTAAEEYAASGMKNPAVVTDNVRNKKPSDVKPYGVVKFIEPPNMAEVIRFALTELQKASPVLTGRYASSHVIYIDGNEVGGDIWGALRNLKGTERVQIVNEQPYARKLEGAAGNKKTGRKKRKGTSRKARNGIYRPVLKLLVSTYSKSMFFDMKWVKIPSLGVKVWGQQGGGSKKRVQRDQVYPALQFYQKPSSTEN